MKAMHRPTFQSLEPRRLLFAGYLDPTFGDAGRIFDHSSIDFGTADDVAVQHDGKVLLCTTDSAEGDFHLRRFLSNGKPDTTFGAGGTVMVNSGLDATRPLRMAVQ